MKKALNKKYSTMSRAEILENLKQASSEFSVEYEKKTGKKLQPYLTPIEQGTEPLPKKRATG